METNGKYYLGKIFDPKTNSLTDSPLLYDPDDLTTHAVVVGMTGSGKTGLCMDLLEEAALNGIPALMIDPKGDITNELLHFPNLLPEDFKPWVNPDEARRDGKTLDQAAVDTASLWQNGLAKWGIGKDRLKQLSESAHYAIYTPGSDAGIPVSILASLAAPQIPWEDNKELIREKISATATALLGLVGFTDIDPVRSREHILLANIFEHAWSRGQDLTLGELIMQTQTPPFNKLGVFDVNTFFSEKDRFELSMQLNNILASPAFQTWIEGEPLDIGKLLYHPDGKPRHSVFYIAHLNDAERMFFVALLYAAIETWMRSQPGSTSLKAIVYFDEIFGYLPPVANPPSKQPMLRMLKTARAFGVAQVLVTQNPVDLDYKALSNTGTWMIGKLQTDQDKQRLLDGLEGAVEGGLNRGAYDKMISTLGKRVFLLHNVHEKKPELFNTRWAMNYLAGPLTRTQIPALNTLVGAKFEQIQAQELGTASEGTVQSGQPVLAAAQKPKQKAGTRTRPRVPAGIAEVFLPNNLTVSQAFKNAGRDLPFEIGEVDLVYRPMLTSQAVVRFLNRKYNLDYEITQTVGISKLDKRGFTRWEDHTMTPFDTRLLDSTPDPRGLFGEMSEEFSDQKFITGLERDFVDWVYRETELKLLANEELALYSDPDSSPAEFNHLCEIAAKERLEDEIAKNAEKIERKLQALETKLMREERELDEDRDELSARKMEEYGTHAENLLGMFGKRRSSRRISSSLSKRRMTSKAKADVEESEEMIELYQDQIEDLEIETKQLVKDLEAKWQDVASRTVDISVKPFKKDIIVELFGIAWAPYHRVGAGEHAVEVKAYSMG